MHHEATPTLPPPARSRKAWLLGTDAEQRVRIERSLIAAGVYVICIGLLAYAVQVDMIPAGPARALGLLIAANVLAFYAVLRSGLNRRFKDPALTLPQILAALTCIVGAYAVTGPVHGSTMMLLTLVMMFGIFNLDARGARIAAGYTVAIFGGTILYKMADEPEHYWPKQELVNFVITATIIPTVSMLAAQLARMRSKLRLQKDELSEALERIQVLATRDDLTGLVNRRHMSELLTQHQKRLARSGHHIFCLALLDIDHFKRVNDEHGHAVGDEVLRGFAREALDVLRETDVLARWGGEEFLVLLSDTDPARARIGLDRLRERLQATAVAPGHPGLRVSYSAGLTAYTSGEPLDAAIERADHALYRAKAAGRDRIELG